MRHPLVKGLREIVALVAILNILYFALELAVALRINSVALLADSADFFEDAAVNFLILAALGWSAVTRARAGAALAGFLLIPAVAFIATLIGKFGEPVAPDPLPLALTGGGALAINMFCAFLLARHRSEAGSLSKAAFLSARNDAIANIAVVTAGLVTLFLWRSIWPDIIVGIGIAAMNADSARSVWNAARDEQRHLLVQPADSP